MKQKVKWEGTTIVVSYPTISKEFRGNTAELPSAIYQDCAAARHGLEQKLRDAASGGAPQKKFEEVRAIWASLKAGRWNRTPGRDGVLGDEELIEEAFLLVVRAKGMKGAAAEEKAAALTEAFFALPDEERKAYAQREAFKAALDQAKAARVLAAKAAEEGGPEDLDLDSI